MTLLPKLLPHRLPAFVNKMILAKLFAVTASAFGYPAPSLVRLTHAKRLQAYALFTRAQAERALASDLDPADAKTRLYEGAYPIGAIIRRWSGAVGIQDAVELGQVLYRAIGVDMHGGGQGNLTIAHCYYCRFYSPQVCSLISALDDGIFSGLSGGARLAFSQRLTEGRDCCKAKLSFPEGAIQ